MIDPTLEDLLQNVSVFSPMSWEDQWFAELVDTKMKLVREEG